MSIKYSIIIFISLSCTPIAIKDQETLLLSPSRTLTHPIENNGQKTFVFCNMRRSSTPSRPTRYLNN